MGKHARFLPFTLLAAVFALTFSCKEDKLAQDFTSGQADSLIFEAGVQKDYEHMVSLVDSLERVGSISVMNADRWRGTAYYRQGQYRSAEFYYKKVMDGAIETTQDSLAYVKSARRLSELLLIKGDYEGSLRVAMPAVQKLQESGYGSDIDYAILLNNIGCCQLYLGYDDEAKESFATARGHYKNRWQTDSTSRGYQEAVLGTVYTSQAYINTRHFAEAAQWIDRTDSLLTLYHEMPFAVGACHT